MLQLAVFEVYSLSSKQFLFLERSPRKVPVTALTENQPQTSISLAQLNSPDKTFYNQIQAVEAPAIGKSRYFPDSMGPSTAGSI